MAIAAQSSQCDWVALAQSLRIRKGHHLLHADLYMLRRFLKARNWELPAARKMWADMLAFRCAKSCWQAARGTLAAAQVWRHSQTCEHMMHLCRANNYASVQSKQPSGADPARLQVHRAFDGAVSVSSWPAQDRPAGMFLQQMVPQHVRFNLQQILRLAGHCSAGTPCASLQVWW
jgi:hypothetical protein